MDGVELLDVFNVVQKGDIDVVLVGKKPQLLEQRLSHGLLERQSLDWELLEKRVEERAHGGTHSVFELVALEVDFVVENGEVVFFGRVAVEEVFFGQNEEQDQPSRPDVGLLIYVQIEHLGGNVIGIGLQQLNELIVEAFQNRRGKIRELNFVILHEDVAGIDAFMDDFAGMQVGERLEEIVEDLAHLFLGEVVVPLDVVVEVALLDVFEHDVEEALVLEVLVHLENVWVVELSEQVDFLLDFEDLLGGAFFLVDDFDGPELLGAEMNGLLDFFVGRSAHSFRTYVVFENNVVQVPEFLYFGRELFVFQD